MSKMLGGGALRDARSGQNTTDQITTPVDAVENCSCVQRNFLPLSFTNNTILCNRHVRNLDGVVIELYSCMGSK